jgi:hypothetical protein
MNNDKTLATQSQPVRVTFGKWPIYILIFIILWIISRVIYIKVNNKALFDWWNSNNGNLYKNKFNLFNFLAFYQSTVIYNLSKLTMPSSAVLSEGQIRFIMGEVFPYQTYVINGTQYGLITPKSLCNTVKLSTDDDDDKFNYWFQYQASPSRDVDSTLYYSSTSSTDTSTNITTYTFTIEKDPVTDKYGVYPSSTDHTSWMGLIQEWLGSGWAWTQGENGLWVPKPISGSVDDTTTKQWFDGRGDNFFARMDIPPDAPIIVYFCNGQYTVDGTIIDALAMKNLLAPIGTNTGGWIGFVQGMGVSISQDELRNFIRTDVEFSYPTPPNCQGSNTENSIMTGLSSGVPIASMGMFLGFPAGLIPAAIGLGMGIFSGIEASKSKC